MIPGEVEQLLLHVLVAYSSSTVACLVVNFLHFSMGRFLFFLLFVRLDFKKKVLQIP